MKQPDLCDVCKRAPVTKGGYLLTTKLNGLLTMTVAAADDGYSQGGFSLVVCGQDCLMRHINAEVAMLHAAPAANAEKHHLAVNPWHKDYEGGAA